MPPRVLTLLTLLLVPTPSQPLPPDARAELTRWRAEQDARMRAPDSPLARDTTRDLTPGHNRLGSGQGDALRFDRPGLPPAALDLVWQGETVMLEPLLPLVLRNGEPAVPGPVQPGDRIAVGPLTLSIYWNQPALAPRVPALAVSDASRSEFLAYRGLHYLPEDGRYRVPAMFEPAAAGRTLTLETSTGGERILPLRGVLHFTLDGRPLSLDAFALGERPNDLFVIFKDRTSGHATYGPGRFVWVPGAVHGKAVIDFNLAWNPLCAYSPAFNCPLAPAENRLPVAIPVGEATYPH